MSRRLLPVAAKCCLYTLVLLAPGSLVVVPIVWLWRFARNVDFRGRRSTNGWKDLCGTRARRVEAHTT